MGIKPQPKRVGIFGAGAAGLCAARHSIDNGYDVMLFEQQHDLGGTWLYSPEPNSFSSLYEKMNTNIPKEVMSFEHLPLTTEGPESFVPHQQVFAYLQRYGQPVLHLIKFNTVVTKIWHSNNEWKVMVKPTKPALTNGHTNGVENGHITRTEVFSFDVIFVCNGHFSSPRVPGFAEKLKIHWLHSHNYRRPHGYIGKVVAVVGAGPSGVDLAIQVAKYAKTVYLLHNQKHKFGMPSNVFDNARVIGVTEDGRTLLLENGEELPNLDAVIFCTGYYYEVPFCDRSIIDLKANGRYLSPLYLHCVNIHYPTSLFFIGLNQNLIPFVCFDYQVNYALALVDGTARVPPKEEMEQFEIDRLRQLKANDQPESFFHQMGEKQWPYFELLAKLSNRPGPTPVLRKIYDHVHDQRSRNLATFKSNRYRIRDSESFDYEELVDLDCN